MATMIKSGYEITVGTDEIEYEFADLDRSQVIETTITIMVKTGNSGTIQFSKGTAVAADHHAAASEEKIVMDIKNGYTNLRAKGSASGQKFSVYH